MNSGMQFYDKESEEICSNIISQLIDRFESSESNGYLLIDLALRELWEDDELIIACNDLTTHSILFPYTEFNQQPQLLLVRFENTHLAREFLMKCVKTAIRSANADRYQKNAICGWLTSTLPGDTLATVLAGAMIQSINEVGDILFRYYDPAVIGKLSSILSEWQLTRLFSNINDWWFIDINNKLKEIKGDNSLFIKLEYSLALEAKQFDKLSVIKDISVVLDNYRLDFPHVEINETSFTRSLLDAFNWYIEHFNYNANDFIFFGKDVLRGITAFYLSPVFDPRSEKNDIQFYAELKELIPLETINALGLGVEEDNKRKK
ncbi:hypothetical protein CIG19_21050 [Enterobacterales bacterium CwR94]|nr:hypothetical protein CIG19_21050 [Enterobacterales bacterium CwR94]